MRDIKESFNYLRCIRFWIRISRRVQVALLITHIHHLQQLSILYILHTLTHILVFNKSFSLTNLDSKTLHGAARCAHVTGYLDEFLLFLVYLLTFATRENFLDQLLYYVVVHRVCIDMTTELMEVSTLHKNIE